jgi:branched-chain amino acid transport system substrate-binding protein
MTRGTVDEQKGGGLRAVGTVRQRKSWLALLAATLAFTGACGTRVNRQSAGSTGTQPSASSAWAVASPQGASEPLSGAGQAASTGQPVGAAGAAAATPAGSGASSAAGTTVPRGRVGAVSEARPATAGTGATAGAARPGPATPKVGPAATPAPAAPGAAPEGKRSPIIVANVGTFSGPIGNLFLAYAQGVQLWAKWVNSRGGVNSHEVRLLILDDGGDPARHRALVQQAIDQQHAIAFLAQADAVTGRSSVDLIEGRGVPVVGTDTGGGWAYTSPMVFPLAATDRFYMFSNLAMAARVAIPQGKKKLASMVCVESEACSNGGDVVKKTAARMGFDLVYQAKVSVAQPDFTAECLAAHNAGAEVLFIANDTNSVTRTAASCARQGYRPMYAVFANAALPSWKNDPNLDGTIAMANSFPWFQTNTPATDEFQQALKAFGGGMQVGGPTTHGWRAGKAFEKAAAQISEPPTSAAVLAGLWSFRDDDLGGLTYPLTFKQGEPVRPRACWWTVVLRDGSFQSPDGFQQHCAEPPLPLY